MITDIEECTISKEEIARRVKEHHKPMTVFGFKNFELLPDDEETLYVLTYSPELGKYIWMGFAYRSTARCGGPHGDFHDTIEDALDYMDAVYVAEGIDDIIEAIATIQEHHIRGRIRA
jgi:hypothetical protein